MSSVKRAFGEGAEAKLKGLDIETSNSYPPGFPEHEAFRDGYEAAAEGEVIQAPVSTSLTDVTTLTDVSTLPLTVGEVFDGVKENQE